jgi:hypothetical protein
VKHVRRCTAYVLQCVLHHVVLYISLHALPLSTVCCPLFGTLRHRAVLAPVAVKIELARASAFILLSYLLRDFLGAPLCLMLDACA